MFCYLPGAICESYLHCQYEIIDKIYETKYTKYHHKQNGSRTGNDDVSIGYFY